MGLLAFGLVTLLIFLLLRWAEPVGELRPERLGGPSDRPAVVVPLTAPAFLPDADSEDFKQEAFATANQLIEAYPERPDALAVLGRLQYSLGNADAAEATWRRCLDTDQGFTNAYFALGVIAKDRTEFAVATEMFQEVMRQAPEDPFAPPLLAEVFFLEGNFLDAIRVLNRHVHQHDTSPDALVTLGQSYLALEQLENARQTFAAMTASYPEDREGYYGLASVYRRLGQLDQARQTIEEFQQHVSTEEENVRRTRAYDDLGWLRDLLVKTLWESGQAYRRFGDPGKAEEMYRKAAHLDDGHLECRHALLSLFEEQGRDRDALEVAEQLAAVEPGNSAHWLNVGLLQARLEQFDAALHALGRAVQLDPHHQEIQRAYELVEDLAEQRR